VGDAGALAALPQGAVSKAGFVCAVQDFYLTNPIARASAVMAECSALAKGRLQQAAE
jgi:NADH-quinone oxidoreductase subunit G